jgi:hypothetical protein
MSMTDAQRNALVANADWLYSWSKYIGYAQERPFPILTKAQLTTAFSKGETVSGDCWWFIVQIYALVPGLTDPGGYDFNGDGNTESGLARLPHYTNPVDAHPGALVIFGADLDDLDLQHGCMVIKQGKDPLVESHGLPGVKQLTLSEEQTAHTGTTVFLDVSGL